MLAKLKLQAREAGEWRDKCLRYFQAFSKGPLPAADDLRPVTDIMELVTPDSVCPFKRKRHTIARVMRAATCGTSQMVSNQPPSINSAAFQIARRGTSREINRQISLNLIREKQPISRAELARLMGMRPGAVSLIVNDLLEAGLLFEGSKGESKGGRRPTQLYIETRRRCAIAVDINASHTSIVERPARQPLD